MKDFSLFTGEVLTINLKNEVVAPIRRYTKDDGTTSSQFNYDYSKIAYTATIIPSGYRNSLFNVPILNSNSLTFNPPLIGDKVLCGMVEGVYPVCLGALYSPFGREDLAKVISSSQGLPVNKDKTLPTDLLPSASEDETVTNADYTSGNANEKEYRAFDYVIQHQTGSYIRMRNLAKASITNGVAALPDNNLPEIKIYQKLAASSGSTDSYNSIALSEATAGSSTIEIKHHSGAFIKVDTTGNIILYPASGKDVLLGSDSASHGVPLGDTLKNWLDSHIHPTSQGPSGSPTTSSPSPSTVVLTL